jgi:hypothetical protein
VGLRVILWVLRSWGLDELDVMPATQEEVHTDKLRRIKESIEEDAHREEQRSVAGEGMSYSSSSKQGKIGRKQVLRRAVRCACAAEVIDEATGRGQRTFKDGATVEIELI